MTLKEARLISGLKVQKICESMGFGRSFLYGLENNKYPVSSLYRKKFSELYGCKVTDIQYAKTN